MKKFAPYIIIGILLSLLLLSHTCRRSPDQEPTIIHTSETIPGDPVPVPYPVPAPYPVEVILPPDTFWRHTDTAAIMAQCRKLAIDYYSVRIYNDTLKDDTSAFIALIDTLQNNRLRGRTLWFQNRRATIINNTTTIYGELPRVKVYFGLGISAAVETRHALSPPAPAVFNLGLSPKILIMGKKSFGAGYGYDIFNKSHEVSIYWKLSFKQKRISVP